MSAQAGWYPDPGGGQDLYRYWDGRAWSAATSPNPSAPAPAQSILGPGRPSQGYGSTPLTGGTGTAYAHYQRTQQRRSPVGWWLAGAALVAVIVLVAVFAVRAATSSGVTDRGLSGGQGTQDVCPTSESPGSGPGIRPSDGRVHGGPVSYPVLGSPWSAPGPPSNPVPFGSDVLQQSVTVEPNYAGTGNDWVASILVAELQAGDGFFSPQQGSQVVVKCVIGAFYGNSPVTSDVKVDEAATIDGHEAWLVESQLSFDIAGLRTKGELLIVAIVSAGTTSGLYYASIPDTRPELVQPARDALRQLTVDG